MGNEYQASKNKELITIDKKSFNESFAFAVDKNNKELLERLNQAIAKVTKDNKITYLDWLKSRDVFLRQVE